MHRITGTAITEALKSQGLSVEVASEKPYKKEADDDEGEYQQSLVCTPFPLVTLMQMHRAFRGSVLAGGSIHSTSLGSIQFSGYLRIPPFSPFFHLDTWILGFFINGPVGKQVAFRKNGKNGTCPRPIFHPFAPHFYTIFLHFSFLLEHFHTFSMMYL